MHSFRASKKGTLIDEGERQGNMLRCTMSSEVTLQVLEIQSHMGLVQGSWGVTLELIHSGLKHK